MRQSKTKKINIQLATYCRANDAILIIAKLNRLGRNVAFVAALLENKIKIVAVQYPNPSKFLLPIIEAALKATKKEV